MSDAREQGAIRFATVLALALIWVAAGALLASNALTAPLPWLNHDVSFLTYVGGELLGSDRLYVEVLEMNPPGSHYLHAGLVAIAGRLGASPFLVTQLFFVVVGLAGVVWIGRSLRGQDAGLVFALVSLAYALVLVRGNFSNNVTPSVPWIPYDFGQREHLFSLLFLPYLIGRLKTGSRFTPWLLPVLLLLGYVSMYKPYWPLMILAVEGVGWRRQGRAVLPFALALVAGMSLPQLILLIESREGFATFWATVVPFLLGGSYAPYGVEFREFARSALHVQMASAFVLFAVCWIGCWRGRRMERDALVLLAGLVLWSYAVVLHQGKYWSYHGMTYFACVSVTGCWLLGRWLQAVTPVARRVGGALAAVLLLLICGVSLFNLRWMLEYYPAKGAELVPLLEGRNRVMFLATGADYIYAPLRLGTEIAGPWREHYRVPTLAADPDGERGRRGLEAYGEQVATVIRDERPELLLFAPLSSGLPQGVHLHDILDDHGAVPHEDYARWEFERSDPRLAGWIVYRRWPAALLENE